MDAYLMFTIMTNYNKLSLHLYSRKCEITLVEIITTHTIVV